jgi:hypothetical protein
MISAVEQFDDCREVTEANLLKLHFLTIDLPAVTKTLISPAAYTTL